MAGTARCLAAAPPCTSGRMAAAVTTAAAALPPRPRRTAPLICHARSQHQHQARLGRVASAPATLSSTGGPHPTRGLAMGV